MFFWRQHFLGLNKAISSHFEIGEAGKQIFLLQNIFCVLLNTSSVSTSQASELQFGLEIESCVLAKTGSD